MFDDGVLDTCQNHDFEIVRFSLYLEQTIQDSRDFQGGPKSKILNFSKDV